MGDNNTMNIKVTNHSASAFLPELVECVGRDDTGLSRCLVSNSAVFES